MQCRRKRKEGNEKRQEGREKRERGKREGENGMVRAQEEKREPYMAMLAVNVAADDCESKRQRIGTREMRPAK